MSIELFLSLLLSFSVVSSLITEVLKNTFNLNGNITAFAISILVGVAGTIIYFVLCSIAISMLGFLYAILMGLAVSLVSQLGYDKVKEAILTLKE